jgi:cytochrome P450
MGENVVACEGAQWRRLAKILRRPFNEAVMSTVWQATLDQLIPLRKKWCEAEGGVIVGDDIPKMALGVMCGAGFGVTVPFESEGEQRLLQGDEFFASTTPPQGFHFNFGGALQHLLSNLVTVLATKLLVPAWLLTHGPVPRKWREGAISLKETRTYIQKLLDRERQRNEAGYYAQDAHRSNLLTTVTNPESSGGLTEDEQVANTFILGLAGHETVAGTLRYSLVLLALFEDKQHWFLEELDEALAGLEHDDWTYEKLFPRLVPCLCIMVITKTLFPDER